MRLNGTHQCPLGCAIKWASRATTPDDAPDLWFTTKQGHALLNARSTFKKKMGELIELGAGFIAIIRINTESSDEE